MLLFDSQSSALQFLTPCVGIMTEIESQSTEKKEVIVVVREEAPRPKKRWLRGLIRLAWGLVILLVLLFLMCFVKY